MYTCGFFFFVCLLASGLRQPFCTYWQSKVIQAHLVTHEKLETDWCADILIFNIGQYLLTISLCYLIGFVNEDVLSRCGFFFFF